MIRLLDLLLSFLIVLILLPFFFIISILIKIDSRGPVIFKQVRVGQHGNDFTLLKFRTMYGNSDKKLLLTVGENDTRITKIGKFLRKFKIDELPQFFNVLKGEMSLVGPRPEVRKYVELYSEKQKKILSVKPGITDYASIAFRNENDILSGYSDPEDWYVKNIMPRKIELNLKYVNQKSISNYCRIVLLTIWIIIKNE